LQGTPDKGAYTADEAALRHGAGVEKETTDANEAYARFPDMQPTQYRDGWLPSSESKASNRVLAGCQCSEFNQYAP
jgi:hypothetical protein